MNKDELLNDVIEWADKTTEIIDTMVKHMEALEARIKVLEGKK